MDMPRYGLRSKTICCPKTTHRLIHLNTRSSILPVKSYTCHSTNRPAPYDTKSRCTRQTRRLCFASLHSKTSWGRITQHSNRKYQKTRTDSPPLASYLKWSTSSSRQTSKCHNGRWIASEGDAGHSLTEADRNRIALKCYSSSTRNALKAKRNDDRQNGWVSKGSRLKITEKTTLLNKRVRQIASRVSSTANCAWATTLKCGFKRGRRPPVKRKLNLNLGTLIATWWSNCFYACQGTVDHSRSESTIPTTLMGGSPMMHLI
jgi:hypothetical protein